MRPRPLLVLLALCPALAVAAVPTVSITGSVSMPNGGSPTKGTITCRLSQPGTVFDGTSFVRVASETTFTLTSGAMPVGAALVPNSGGVTGTDSISPAATGYVCTFSLVTATGRPVTWVENWTLANSPSPISIGAIARASTGGNVQYITGPAGPAGTASAVNLAGVSSTRLSTPYYVATSTDTGGPRGFVAGTPPASTGMLGSGLYMANDVPAVIFMKTTQPANSRLYQIFENLGSVLEVNRANDDGTNVQTYCQFDFYTGNGTPSFKCVNGIHADGFRSLLGYYDFYQSGGAAGYKVWRLKSTAAGLFALSNMSDDQSQSSDFFKVQKTNNNVFATSACFGNGCDASDSTSTLQLYNSTAGMVTRLWVREGTAQGSSYEAFGVYGNNGTSSRLRVINGKVELGAAGTGISGSYRGTATLATSAISANLCAAEQSVTVTNAATGAECDVGMPATIENGLVWSCYVSAAGTAKLRVCNHTSGSITPAGSQTVAVRVFNP